ncbi:hypothetical protein M1271_00925 [Patescibacteria group bacterium]|nr:hypothetical protein [Patescibacteria group bacterium]
MSKRNVRKLTIVDAILLLTVVLVLAACGSPPPPTATPQNPILKIVTEAIKIDNTSSDVVLADLYQAPLKDVLDLSNVLPQYSTQFDAQAKQTPQSQQQDQAIQAAKDQQKQTLDYLNSCYIGMVKFRRYRADGKTALTDGHSIPASGKYKVFCPTEQDRQAGMAPNQLALIMSVWWNKSMSAWYYSPHGIRPAYFGVQLGTVETDPTFNPNQAPPANLGTQWWVGTDCNFLDLGSNQRMPCSTDWVQQGMSVAYAANPTPGVVGVQAHILVLANGKSGIRYVSAASMGDNSPMPPITGNVEK